MEDRVVSVRRLTLSIHEADLHRHPWEQWFAQPDARQFDAIVRLSDVPARAAQATFTPPLRVVLCDTPDPVGMSEELRALFGWRDPDRDKLVEQAFRCGVTSLDDLEGPESVPLGWPVVDVLHMFRLPALGPGVRRLSGYPGDRGSLGWLSQLLHAWQVRMLVIDVRTRTRCASCTRLCRRRRVPWRTRGCAAAGQTSTDPALRAHRP